MTPGYLAICWCLQQEERTCERDFVTVHKHVKHDHILIQVNYNESGCGTEEAALKTAPSVAILTPENGSFLSSVILGLSAEFNTQ